MKKQIKLLVATSVSLSALALSVACTVPPDPSSGGTGGTGGQSGGTGGTGGTGSNACGGTGWRNQTPPDTIICPGTPNCYCASPQVCCLASIDSRAGSCTTYQACSYIALTCDSPNDCNGGVCCLDDRTGGGSICKAAGDCTSPLHWLCNGDADCVNGGLTAPGGGHCRPADYGTDPGVPNTALDDEVGVCGT